MKTRDVTRAIVVTGWTAGIVLILAGVPFLVVLAALVLLAVAALTAAWRGSALVSASRDWAAPRVSRLLKRRIKTGRAVERA